jgi:hypothetical protein
VVWEAEVVAATVSASAFGGNRQSVRKASVHSSIISSFPKRRLRPIAFKNEIGTLGLLHEFHLVMLLQRRREDRPGKGKAGPKAPRRHANRFHNTGRQLISTRNYDENDASPWEEIGPEPLELNGRHLQSDSLAFGIQDHANALR